MARKLRHSGLETPAARLRLPVRNKPYPGPSLKRGARVTYRRNKTAGAWGIDSSDGHGKRWIRRIADADDLEAANGASVMSFHQAVDAARKLVRGGSDEGSPLTIDGALTAYEADLVSRGAGRANAKWPRKHLTTPLLNKPVGLLSAKELSAWKLSLLGTIKAASVNRLMNCLCAALELAAQHDERIKNQDAWRVGCAGLPDSQRARNTVLSDEKVHRLISAAYEKDRHLGWLVDVLGVTGSRPSQASRLRVEDLHDHPSRPKLMMPKSGKGGGRNRSQKKTERYSVPITAALAARLKEAAAGRAPDAPLLTQAGGGSWSNTPTSYYSRNMREILTAMGEPATTTLYCLRHSSITRMLLRNVPIRVIAALHNTSVNQIEKNYSANLPEHSDEISRVGLLAEPAPVAANVVAIKRRR